MRKSLLFFFCALMSFVNLMAQNEAKLGDEEYATLREAVAASNEASSDVTITLLQSVVDDNPLSFDFNNSNANVTLDLNGNTFNVTKGNVIVNGKLKIVNSSTTRGTLTTGTKMTLIYVKGTGQLDINAKNLRIYSANRTIYVDALAKLNFDGGETTPKDLDYNQIESREAACVENYGVSVVKNAKMISTGEYGRCFLNKKGTIEVANVYCLTTYYNVLKMDPGCGDVTVSDSYFECQNFSGTINNSSTVCTLTLNNVQCYNKNVKGWHYNHADHRAIYGATGSKIIINGGKYWSDINQAISTDGEIIATGMTITTRPLRGGANAKFTLTDCNISVGNYTTIDITATTGVQITGGKYTTSSHIMNIPAGQDVTIKGATFVSSSASASLFACHAGANATIDDCVLTTGGVAVQMAENSSVNIKDCKVKALTPIAVPEPEEGGSFADLNVTVEIDNSVFSDEVDAQILPAGYISFRNTDPETALDYPYAITSCQDAFAAYKAGAAAYARSLKDDSYSASILANLEAIATQIEAMEYDESKSYEEQIAQIENLLGSIDGLYIAVIGADKYFSLGEAVQAANSANEDVTIQLANSFADESNEIIEVNNTNGKAITLDVNGKSFTLKKNGIDIYSTLNVLNSSTAKSTLSIAGVSGAFMFRANNGGKLNINGANCAFTGANANNRIVMTAGTGSATVDGGTYSAKHNCFLGDSEGLLLLKNLKASTSGQVTIAVSKGPAELENVVSSVSGIYNALYTLAGAGDVSAKNSSFIGNNNASVVKVYANNGVLTLDKCEIYNSANWSHPEESDYNVCVYIDAASKVIVKNESYIHSLTNRPVRCLGSIEAENSTLHGYYGFKVEGTSAKAKLTDCNVSARYNGAFVVAANSSPNYETTISGGEFSATNNYVFNIGAGNKVKIDGIHMSGTGNGLMTFGEVTVTNSTLGSSESAVRIANAGKASLADCVLEATTPLAKADGVGDHVVKCEGKVIANNIIDELMLEVGIVCGANTDEETNSQYPYVAKAGTEAFNDYRTIVKTYIEEYKTSYSTSDLMSVIDEQIAALDAMTYDPNTVFAYQAADMLNKAKNVACALMDIVQGDETDEEVTDMVALVKENINSATDTSLLEIAKNDGMNAIIYARKHAVEVAKAFAKEAIDEAVRDYYSENAVLEVADNVKQIIDAAMTTAEVEKAKADGLKAVDEAINAVTGIVDVDDVNTKEATVVYNLSGSKLSSVSSSGIYIINNKKVFIRK